MTITVRVAGPQFRYDYEQYDHGAELEVPERVLERHPRTLERIEDEVGSDISGTGVGEADGATEVELDADEWLDQEYSEREQAVLDGEVDTHLEKIQRIETSETVKDAVDERQEG